MAGFDDNERYEVVVNHEEQYSIWPVGRETPAGWKKVGFQGTKPDALKYIEEVWTDLRPLSLRKKLEELENEAAKMDAERRG